MIRGQSGRFDAIVVGSGITGGWAAKELTERGLTTLVLEAGRSIEPTRDYTEHIQAWQLPFRGYGDTATMAREQPIQKNCYACDEWGSKFFVNDLENPYTFDEKKPFHWIRGRHVGGGPTIAGPVSGAASPTPTSAASARPYRPPGRPVG